MADSVTVADVRHVASLARLGLSDERVLQLTRDLNTILEHMQALSGVDTTGIEPVAGVGGAGMRLRPDKGPPIPLEERPESFAPEMRAGLFIVPRLETHGDPESLEGA
jgi:aspartyl-tRNA(Asn)/glutamyl-tRNA(Gln) amidotransferase subunit C